MRKICPFRMNNSLEETAESVLALVDIVEEVSKDLNLEQAGINFRGVCPWCKDEAQTFYVYPNIQAWACMPCGVSGNAISYLAATKGIAYRDALDALAAEAGADMPDACLLTKCEWFDPMEAKCAMIGAMAGLRALQGESQPRRKSRSA